MKKILYVSIFEKNSFKQDGVIKKIKAQLDAFKKNNCKVYFTFQEEGELKLQSDNECINMAKMKSSFFFSSMKLYRELEKNIKKDLLTVDIAYIRDQGPNINLILMLRQMKKKNIITLMELPTYPIKGERNKGIKNKIRNLHDDTINYYLKFYLDYIITYSNEEFIYNIPCINIVNGINLEEVTVIEKEAREQEVVFTAVSTCCYWHGIDRMLLSLEEYIDKRNASNIYFNIVGEGPEIKKLKEIVMKSKVLKKYVKFHGFKSADELNCIYNSTSIAVGSLGRHRSKNNIIRPLKNVEYAAKGLPMIYSETDPGFDNCYFVYKVEPDESLLNIEAIIRWYNAYDWNKNEIRDTVKDFTWINQINNILTRID